MNSVIKTFENFSTIPPTSASTIKKNSLKILKKISKECPECGQHKLVVIQRSHVVSDIAYTDKFEYCQICEYEEKIKDKKNTRKFIVDDI